MVNRPARRPLARSVSPPGSGTEALTECWIEVGDAGGPAGFPFAPVDPDEVGRATDRLVTALAPRAGRLLVVTVEDVLVGRLDIRRDANPLVAHWASSTTCRAAWPPAAGLEVFHQRLGRRGTGRWPNAPQLAPDDQRDEVLVLLDPLWAFVYRDLMARRRSWI